MPASSEDPPQGGSNHAVELGRSGRRTLGPTTVRARSPSSGAARRFHVGAGPYNDAQALVPTAKDRATAPSPGTPGAAGPVAHARMHLAQYNP